MKEKTLARLDRLEEVIRLDVSFPHGAIKYPDGTYCWNGDHYPDEESFNHAVGLIPAEVWREKPLVVISIQEPKSESARNDVQP